jgi:hypothetical protein
MAILRKTALFQVRCHAADLAAFEASCEVIGMKPTERIRRFMVADAQAIAKKVAAKAQWDATRAHRAAAAAAAAAATSASPEPQKPPVEPVVASEGPLARKRRLEKEAKDARRAAKRHNRY